MMVIREFEKTDWPAVWSILEPIFRQGETYVFAPDITEEEAHRVWIEVPETTFVAIKDQQIVGTYYLKPNQPGSGSHICNCGYAVAESARGQGVASAMCQHSQQIAIDRNYLGMQFNFVVSTNSGAIRLWKQFGFQVIGTIPNGFQHPRLSFVDAHIMFKDLSGTHDHT